MTVGLTRSFGGSYAVLAIGLLTIATACERRPETPRPPSVLLITLDTTRADRLGCYGYPGGTSPNLDQLAERGALFTNAMTQASVTPVSHASILTGQYPYTHGLRVMHGVSENRLGDSNVTLAEVLRDAGYATGAFVSAFPVTERFGLNQGFDTFDDDFIVDDASAIVSDRGVVNTNNNQRRADATTDRALAWLRKTRSPFFLWLHYFDPHDAMVLPPREYMKRLDDATFASNEDRLRAIYDLEIRYMDEQIGRVLDYLRDSQRLDKMIVVVTSDHGEGLGDHDWWTHGILYQEQIHAPLILRGPSVPKGRRIDSLVRSIDIMPTVLTMAGVDEAKRPQMDGASLTPLFPPDAVAANDTGYADSINMLVYRAPVGKDKKDDVLYAIRDGKWKYIHHSRRPRECELYDLENDPREENNLYLTKRRVAMRLLTDLRARDCVPKPASSTDVMDPTERQKLIDLGYIDEPPESQPTSRPETRPTAKPTPAEGD